MRLPRLVRIAAALAAAAGASPVRADPPVNSITPDGHILDWLLLGPFPTAELKETPPDGIRRTGLKIDYLVELGGETKAVLKDETAVSFRDSAGRARTVRARRIGPAFENMQSPVFNHIFDGYVSIKGFSPGQPYIIEEDFNEAVGYAFCYLKSERKQRAYAYFRTFVDAQKVWLNGRLVQWLWREYREDQPVLPGESKWWPRPAAVALDLEPGWNALLVKIESWEWIWQFALTVYDEEHHLPAVRNMEISLDAGALRLAGRDLTLHPRLTPELIDIEAPVIAGASAADGRELARAEGVTGKALALKIPASYSGPVTVRLSPAGNLLPQLRPVSRTVFAGDFRPAVESARSRANSISAKLASLGPEWRRAYAGVAAWLQAHLGGDLSQGSEWDQKTVRYAEALAGSLETGGNFMARHPGAAFPVSFDWRGRDGSSRKGNYHIHLPRDFPKSGYRYPLIIDLHGRKSGETKLSFEASPKATPVGPYVAMEGPPVIGAAPVHPNGRGGWDPWFLNQFLADVKARFPIDEDRVYLQGGSMGGWGTWDWAIANPEHFAAIAPRCAFEGQPFRAARLRNVPVWVFNGEKDLGAVPALAEVAVNSVRRAGGTAEYTLFPHLGHGFRDDIEKWTVRDWFLRHKRSKEPAPADPLDQLDTNGASRIRIVDLPAITFFTVGEAEQMGGYGHENIARAGLKMFAAYRRPKGMTPLRMADGFFTLRAVGNGRTQMLLEPPAGVECKPEGVLFCVSFPAMRAAQFYFRGAWDQLQEYLKSVCRNLEAQGFRRSGEERYRVHGVRPRKLWSERMFEVQLGLEN